MTILQSCYNYVVNHYNRQSDKVQFLKEITLRTDNMDEDGYMVYEMVNTPILDIIYKCFTEEFRINMFQAKGHTQLQDLLRKEIRKDLNNKELVLYGVGARSQFLCNIAGIDSELVFAIDDSSLKQNRYLQ